MELDTIYNMDCIEGMKMLPDKSIDMILCDLPYGTTACKWDSIIPFDDLWAAYKRIIKDNGAIVLFGSEPFSTKLRASNLTMFRYDWVWNKQRGSNFANARKQPMKSHETISVFYKHLPIYNPQFWFSTPYKTIGRKRTNEIEGLHGGSAANVCTSTISEDGRRYPLSIISFPRDGNRVHPTQKPVALCEYLIKTYTNEGEVVLDNCFGSGTTLVAAVSTNRHYIGFELEPKYFDIACNRLDDAERERENNNLSI